RRAVSWLALYRRRPAGLFREAVHLAQTQTGPLSRSFGREKRIKNVRHGLSRNANAGIGQFERHKCATQAVRVSTSEKLDPANCQRQDSAIRHCVTGVHTKVQQSKLEFALVDMDAARTAVRSCHYFDIAAKRALEHLFELGEHFSKIENGRF